MRVISRIIFGIVISAVCFSGCAVGPKFQVPSMTAPEDYPVVITQSHAESLADVNWWHIFKDEKLQTLIREALQDNYDLRIAVSRVNEYRALLGVTRAGLFPQVDAVVSASRNRNSRAYTPATQVTTSNFGMGFDASWEVDVWGKIRRATEAAKAQYLASEQGQKGVVVTLVADMAQAYFNLRQLDLELEIARRTLQTRAGTVDLFKKREAGGVASRLETAQAEADMFETAALIPDIERQITIQEHQLSVLLGRDPGKIDRGGALTDQYFPPDLPAGLPSQLLERRPDIQEAKYVVKAANAQVGVAIGQFLPKVDLSSFFGSSSHQFHDLWKDDGLEWTIGGDVTLPVFQGGKNVYNLKSVRARWHQTVDEYKLTVLNAFRDVADALVEIKQYQNVRSEEEKQVASNRESAKLSRARYEGGLSSYLEVLDSDRRLFLAETSLAQTRGDQLKSLAHLYRSLGGGWQIEEPKP